MKEYSPTTYWISEGFLYSKGDNFGMWFPLRFSRTRAQARKQVKTISILYPKVRVSKFIRITNGKKEK